MEEILIIGGAGFIGSHLAEAHISKGDSVHVIDSMVYCYPDNIAALRASDAFSVSVENVIRRSWSLNADRHWDKIYMMAGVVSATDFIKWPAEAFVVSIRQIEEVVRYVLARMEIEGEQRTKLLFASSSEVYGNAENVPTTEEEPGRFDHMGARGGYDEGKRAAETMLNTYRIEKNVMSAVVRIFNTFGPRMRANGRLVPSMVRDAIYKGKVTIWGMGSTTRTLLYVDDCVRGIMAAMEHQFQGPINIGGHLELMISEVAEIIAGKLSVPIDYDMSKWDPISRRRPDISRAAKLLRWEPKITVDDGIEKVIQYWEEKDREAEFQSMLSKEHDAEDIIEWSES